MKRIATIAGSAVILACVAAVPVGATMLDSQDSPEAAAAAQAADDITHGALAGTSLAFLALGAGTAFVAHRRRWAAAAPFDLTVDLRGSTRPTAAPANATSVL